VYLSFLTSTPPQRECIYLTSTPRHHFVNF
jgi:hypothetical protein